MGGRPYPPDSDRLRCVRRLALLATLPAVLVALPGCGGGDDTTSPRPRVQLALDFTANAVHAPIFAVPREGLDREHGIELVIRRPGAGPDALGLVASGKLELGLLDIHDLALAREKGVDVVAVGALVKAPLAALVARASVRRPRDLEGRTVGVSGLASDPAFVGAIVRGDGGDPESIREVTIGFNSVASLVSGKVDAAPVFWNAEGVSLRRRGVKVSEFRVEHFGAPSYPEVVLVTSRTTLRERRDDVRAALAALRDGIAVVEQNPAAAVEQIAREAQTTDTGLIAAQLEAVRPIFAADLRLDRAVLEEWADFDASIGIVKRRPDVDEAFDFGVFK